MVQLEPNLALTLKNLGGFGAVVKAEVQVIALGACWLSLQPGLKFVRFEGGPRSFAPDKENRGRA